MNNIYLFFLVAIMMAPTVDALYLINNTKSGAVTFTVTVYGRKNSKNFVYNVPAKSMDNDGLNNFQKSNQMSGFRISVEWQGGATVCLLSGAPGAVSQNTDLSQAAADNFNALLYTDPVTNVFTCLIRSNPPGGGPPSV